MASTTQDSNATLLRKAKELSPEAKQRFQNTFGKAALVLNFLNFLEQQKTEKFRTPDAVLHLYGIKKSQADYALYENRFFKLRKKLLDYFSSSPTQNNTTFTPHEIQLQEIKNLILIGKYQEADPLLISLQQKLWTDNVFELLPEVLDLSIHQNQILKRLELNAPLYKKYDEATELFIALAEAKKISRLIYEVNFTQGLKFTAPLFVKLQRISINHKQYPRFKLIYNFVSAHFKMSGAGLDFVPDFKITSRFISAVRKINEQYPDIPAQKYMAGYRETQQFQFTNLQVTNFFNAGDYRKAADLMSTLYHQVMVENASMKRMRSNIFFSSTCLIQITGERYNDALLTARNYLDYLLEIKQTERVQEAYAEIVKAYTWLYSAPTGFTEAFIKEKLEDYVRFLKPRGSSDYHYLMALWLKVKYLLVTGKFKEAETLFKKEKVSAGFMDKRLENEVLHTIQLLSAAENKKQNAEPQLQKLKLLRLKSKLPPDYINYFFLEKLLLRKLKK